MKLLILSCFFNLKNGNFIIFKQTFVIFYPLRAEGWTIQHCLTISCNFHLQTFVPAVPSACMCLLHLPPTPGRDSAVSPLQCVQA